MQVILLERVEKLGQMGDEVKVKDGFGRNYLLPQKKALRATKANREYFQTQKAQLEARNLENKKEAEKVALDGEMSTDAIIRDREELSDGTVVVAADLHDGRVTFRGLRSTSAALSPGYVLLRIHT